MFSATNRNITIRLTNYKLSKVIEEGYKLIITKLDRITRSLIKDMQSLETLSEKGIIVEVLNLGIIDNSPTGKLIHNIMLCFSEFEHDMIIQRTQEGKAIARQNFDFRNGRPKKFTRVQLYHTLELLDTHSYKQVEIITGISITTIYHTKQEKAKTEHP